MLLTKRDIEILNFINDFGFCEMPQIERQFTLKKPRSYQVVKRLINAGLVVHEYILRNKHGVYRLTRKGTQFTGLMPLRDISLGGYVHQLKVIDVYQQLMKRYPDAVWVSERRLKQDMFSNGKFRGFGHVADGMLVFPDNKEIAIEVELTMKGKERLRKIIRSYSSAFSTKEVWYFCAKDIVNRVKKEAEWQANVKVFDIEGIII